MGQYHSSRQYTLVHCMCTHLPTPTIADDSCNLAVTAVMHSDAIYTLLESELSPIALHLLQMEWTCSTVIGSPIGCNSCKGCQGDIQC